jgi:two-component system, NtrC family, nitrogen regulation sensor histidine kinase NtrY
MKSMRQRYLYGSGVVLLAILVALIVWQTSFTFGTFGPSSPQQTIILLAISTLIFIFAVTLSFMLLRTGLKLYMQRQRNRPGSRLETKLVAGALALTSLPVVFLFAFSYLILNRNLDKWFMVPVEGIKTELQQTARSFNEEIQGRAQALVDWLSLRDDVRAGTANFAVICKDQRIVEMNFRDTAGQRRVLCKPKGTGINTARAYADTGAGQLEVLIEPPVDVVDKQLRIDQFLRRYNALSAERRSIRNYFVLIIALIALFILFVAIWIALQLSRQLSGPIQALLTAAGQVRQGNLQYRVTTPAADEMGTLVHAFNDMTQGLEQNRAEIESRRQFTEVILESIPTGVISLGQEGGIQRVNRAMKALFSEDELARATSVADILTTDQMAEVRYLMKRARRTGVASGQIHLARSGQLLHLAVTVSALPGTAGYVVIVEDTSELLRAQKAAAWHEVARRIAHELKNPLTPIALSAERIARQLDRGPLTADSERILRQCSATIVREVESVKALADEFSQFSRFPAAQLTPLDLNTVVRNAVDVFTGRLDDIHLLLELSPDLPLINADAEQLKRVVVNLVDNAAEALRSSLVKRLLVATRASGDAVELLIADTGPGVSADDKEKLFLPYFSTKERGTGLGLAIVSHIVAEHHGRIRVEDNRPTGAQFYVELPVAGSDVGTMEVENRGVMA